MIKAIFFDIDGTLVSFKTHRISPAVLDGLHRARDRGIKLFIATGRQQKAAEEAVGSFPFDGYITVNGQFCFAGERVLRAPADGVFHQFLDIGAQVKMGDIAAEAGGVPMVCTLDGVLRGILPEGTPVHKGMKAGDIDPRCNMEHCYCASDKALAVGGGVLEALLRLSGSLKSFE